MEPRPYSVSTSQVSFGTDASSTGALARGVRIDDTFIRRCLSPRILTKHEVINVARLH